MNPVADYRTISQLVAEGKPHSAIARALGISPSTITRVLRRGPDHRAGAGRTGRPEAFQLTEPERAALRRLVIARSTQDAPHIALAIEEFATHPDCLPDTREKILAILDRAARGRRAPVWPRSLYREAHVTPEEAARARGPKHAQGEFIVRRGDFWVDEGGHKIPLMPHTIWESDDKSEDAPFSYVDPVTGELTVGRQVLQTRDVYSAAWLSLTSVGRDKDAYRVEDIADHFLDTVRAWGLPTIWRLEKGSWASNFVRGIEVDWPGFGGKRWGGLDGLIHIVNVATSGAKGGIESGFNLQHASMAHRGLTIGRFRGEWESAAKALRQATGAKTAATRERAAAKFWTQSEHAAALADVCAAHNRRPMVRHMFGKKPVVPEDLLGDARGRELPESEAWRFLPVKQTATVRGGHVQVSLPHYPHAFRFRVGGELPDAYLEHGYRVLIAFHPGRPEEGCHVFNGEVGAKNRYDWSPGERLCLAPYAADAPQVDLSGFGDYSGAKKAKAAVRREFRAILPQGRRGLTTSLVQDGQGNRAETRSTGTSRPAAAEAPQPSRKPSAEPAPRLRIEKLEPRADEPETPAPAPRPALRTLTEMLADD